jgi:hypothetical protein
VIPPYGFSEAIAAFEPPAVPPGVEARVEMVAEGEVVGGHSVIG